MTELSVGDLFRLALAVLVVSIIFFAARSQSRFENYSKQIAIQKKAREEQIKLACASAEEAFISIAESHLPNAAKALEYLASGYSWNELLTTIGIYPTHALLLDQLSSGDSSVVLSPPRSVSMEDDDPSPTIVQLRDLVAYGFVHTDDKLDLQRMHYHCVLTDLGIAFLNVRSRHEVRFRSPRVCRLPLPHFTNRVAHILVASIEQERKAS